MKKMTAWLLAGALALGLTGCKSPDVPTRAEDGNDWQESWVTVGGVLGVDTPDGMEPRENNDALAANGMYYATWSMGEAVPFVNGDGEEAQLYDAQIYVLLAGCSSVEDAEDNAAQWLSMAREQYAVEDDSSQTHNGRTFTVVAYTFDSEANPYARGASAFGVYGNFAISVELTCRREFDGDEAQLLAQFLDRCHYAA